MSRCKKLATTSLFFFVVIAAYEHKKVTLCNIYAPPGSDIAFYRKIFNLIATETYGTLICAGDLNMLLNLKLDTTNKTRRRNPLEKETNKILQELGLIDM